MSFESASDRRTLFDYSVCAEMFWKDRPFLERLELIADAGFSRYEFWKCQGDSLPGVDKDIGGIEKIAKQRGIEAAQFLAAWNLNNPENKTQILQDLKSAVAVARRLGAKFLTVLAGREITHLDRPAQIAQVVETLSAGADIVGKAGITLLLEPTNILVDHPGQLLWSSQEAAEIIQAVGSPNVRMTFDVYHQQISEGNLSGNIQRFHDLIGYYQIADYPGRHEPGSGEINMSHILATIYRTGYRGSIGLEMYPTGDPMVALESVSMADRDARMKIANAH